jgi:hypothetical protein
LETRNLALWGKKKTVLKTHRPKTGLSGFSTGFYEKNVAEHMFFSIFSVVIRA